MFRLLLHFVPLQTIAEFINKVCTNCKRLERVVYSDFGKSKTVEQFSIAEAKSQYHQDLKFPNLNFIRISKDDDYDRYFKIPNFREEEQFRRKKAAMEKLKNHLTAKFPNLKNPIKTDDHYIPYLKVTWFLLKSE